jgi:large subunit ribosomal protein L9
MISMGFSTRRASIYRFIIGVATLSAIVSGHESIKFSSTCFVPPAAPTAARADPVSSWFTPSPVMAPATIRVTSTVLSAKKTVAAAGSKKIQVRLLKYVAGTGDAGQVIMVTPAFFSNKLRPTKSAVIISDEQVEKDEAVKTAADKGRKEKANELKDRLSELTLTVSRKAGPDGHLFGGIGPKVVIEELKNQVGDEFLGSKGVKVASLLDGNGKKLSGDIKQTGEFGATITLAKDISAQISIVVEGLV